MGGEGNRCSKKSGHFFARLITDTRLRLIDIEREKSKFFKREQSLHFQNLRAPLSRHLIPECDPLVPTWYETGRLYGYTQAS